MGSNLTLQWLHKCVVAKACGLRTALSKKDAFCIAKCLWDKPPFFALRGNVMLGNVTRALTETWFLIMLRLFWTKRNQPAISILRTIQNLILNIYTGVLPNNSQEYCCRWYWWWWWLTDHYTSGGGRMIGMFVKRAGGREGGRKWKNMGVRKRFEPEIPVP